MIDNANIATNTRYVWGEEVYYFKPRVSGNAASPLAVSPFNFYVDPATEVVKDFREPKKEKPAIDKPLKRLIEF